MNKPKRLVVLLLIGFALLGFFYTLTYDIDGMNQKREFIPVSIIVRGRDSSLYEAMRQGIEQAANDMRVEASFVTLSKENDVQEQTAMIAREINNGAKAIVISAADTEAMTETIRNVAELAPVIAIETPTLAENVRAYITADNYKMGFAIGREAAKKLWESESAILLQNAPGCKDITERERGVIDSFAELNREITVMKIDIDAENAAEQLAEALMQTDCAIACDTSLLEKAAQLLNSQVKGEEEALKCRLYGIGATGKITSFLQKGMINTVVAQNGFNIGYLGIRAAVDAVERKNAESNTEIEYMVVNRNNMYSTKGQRLIFPFSK